MTMPTPLKPKDKHNTFRIKIVNYLMPYSQNFGKKTLTQKIKAYSFHLLREESKDSVVLTFNPLHTEVSN